MTVAEAGTALVALHCQNENCHPDGKIKVGIAADASWREARLANARRLFESARHHGIPIIHVRLAVRPDMRNVIANTPIFRQWLELGAWQEGSWGVEFLDGLGPHADELVVTQMYGPTARRKREFDLLGIGLAQMYPASG